MSPDEYKQLERQPHDLTQEEIENPYSVLQGFFSTFHIPQVRECMWTLLRTAVVGDYCKSLSKRERADMVFFYEKLKKAIEAIHIIHTRQPEVEEPEEEN